MYFEQVIFTWLGYSPIVFQIKSLLLDIGRCELIAPTHNPSQQRNYKTFKKIQVFCWREECIAFLETCNLNTGILPKQRNTNADCKASEEKIYDICRRKQRKRTNMLNHTYMSTYWHTLVHNPTNLTYWCPQTCGKNGENGFLLRVASVAKRKCDL